MAQAPRAAPSVSARPTPRRSLLGRVRYFLCVTPLLATLISASCSFNSVGGDILVGRPEVFTRQRLVNRRLMEQQWLEAQLANTPTAQTFQGLRDVRVFESFYNKTAATFDPLSGRLTVGQGSLTLQSQQNQAQINALQHQIEVLRLQQQLAGLRQSGDHTATSGPSSGSSGSSGGSSSSSTTGGTQPVETTPTTAGASTPLPSGIFNNPSAVPTPDVVTTQAKLTSIEFLRDQLAFRNAVQAALRDQELDDSHDLAGVSLYTLKFDLSVLPHGHGDAYAKVQFTLPQTINIKWTCPSLASAYYSWIWHLRRDVHAEAVALQRRIELDVLSSEEKVRLAAAAAAPAPPHHLALSPAPTPRAPAAPPISTPPGPTPAAVPAAAIPRDPDISALTARLAETARDATPASLDNAKHGAAKLIFRKYKRSLPESIVTVREPFQIGVDGRSYWLPDIPTPTLSDLPGTDCAKVPTSGPLAVFADYLSASGAPAALVTDPKEQAQNISDVAAIEQLKNMVLTLQAVLPQYGLNADTYTEYLRRSQERLQAILRRPLVVAYSDEGQRFGWILGPRFEIGKDGKPRFSHTTVQHSVQVSIVVPGWVPELDVSYQTFWIDRDGQSREVQPTVDADGKRRARSIKVRLPHDDTAITAKFVADAGTIRAPFIEPPVDSANQRQILRVQAGRPAEMVIRGQHLWRNPRVFLGGQPAEKVLVLPDMNGLSARFEAISIPPRKATEFPLLDLVVVTSEGIATLPNAAQVFPDSNIPASE